jgi:hypothetical protein
MSRASAISPPEGLTTATPRADGRAFTEDTSTAVSISSSSVPTRMTLAARKAASHTSSLPATAPVCASTAWRPRSERPDFTTMTGLPSVYARRATSTKRSGRRSCSRKAITVVTAGSSMSASR